MFENITVAPLNWQALVDETLRRRKQENITQKEHAALADVSVPTMAAFDRGDKTLSLVKAFDILRVVGLVNDPSQETIQDVFVKESFKRWSSLTEKEPKDSTLRLPFGFSQFNYYLEGDLKLMNAEEFDQTLKKAVTHHSGLPPFYGSSNTIPEIVGYDMIECRLKNHDLNGTGDYWRASTNGHLFLIRGFQEDTTETFAPNLIFDITLPIWRMGEILLHAERLANLMKKKENTSLTIHFDAFYKGLSGRVLRSWSMPDNMGVMALEGRASRGNEVLLKAEIPAQDVSLKLADYLYPLAAELYQKFGVSKFPIDVVQSVVKRLFNYKKM